MPGHGKSHLVYEESTHEEYQVCGKYRKNAFEVHNKKYFLAQNGKHENIVVSGCAKAHLKERQKTA